MTPRTRATRVLALLLPLLLLSGADPSFGGEGKEGDDLLASSVRLRERLERSVFGIPLFVQSSIEGRALSADAYGIFDHPLESIARALDAPANWSDIATLHPNVKASTYARGSGEWLLTFYCGRKFYQSPEAAERLVFRYGGVEQKPDYVKVSLQADEGPYGTRDHRMKFEAVSLGPRRTFVHVSYSYTYGAALRLAEKIYFSTLARDKVGFTVTGTDGSGRPTYVGGARGAIERNAVRYYFAIQSFLDTLAVPEDRRFPTRVGEWYDLTCRFKRQLYEMEKEEYLKIKAEERKQQDLLQRGLSTLPSGQPAYRQAG